MFFVIIKQGEWEKYAITGKSFVFQILLKSKPISVAIKHTEVKSLNNKYHFRIIHNMTGLRWLIHSFNYSTGGITKVWNGCLNSISASRMLCNLNIKRHNMDKLRNMYVARRLPLITHRVEQAHVNQVVIACPSHWGSGAGLLLRWLDLESAEVTVRNWRRSRVQKAALFAASW